MNKILLPVDGSKRSLRTVEMVQRLCDPAESDITIVKVVSAQLYINSLDEIKRNAEKAQPELDAVAALLPGYQVKTQVLLGSARGRDRGVRQRNRHRYDYYDPFLPGPPAQAGFRGHLYRPQRLVPGRHRHAGGRGRIN